MNVVERFHAIMNYEAVDRVPFWYFGAWPETVEKWKADGVDVSPANLGKGADPSPFYKSWFYPNPPFENEVLDENEEYIVYVNPHGLVVREMKNNPTSSMPQFLRFPVDNRVDFREFWKKRMQPDLTMRIGPDWREVLQEIRSKEQPFIIWSANWGGFFGPMRHLVGVEKLCMMFYDAPDFLQEMMDADADFIIAIMDQILDTVQIDAFQYWEDMAYNAGPLVSPELARKYMLPRYKRVNEFLRSKGVKHIGLDSDGQISSLIPVWMDASIDYLFPFEVQCGMDVNRVRREFGRELRIVGGVDKRALKYGPEAIDAEIARVEPLIRTGGYIPMTDHSIPPDVSYPNFCYYMSRMRETCDQSIKL